MISELTHLDAESDFLLRNGAKRTKKYAARVPQVKIAFGAKNASSVARSQRGQQAGVVGKL